MMAATNNSGGTDATQRFDAWGNKVASTGTTPHYGYTGREPDETGLIYYRARYYDPTLGRFTQRDPIGLIGGVNRYAYALGSPISYTDPLGLWTAQVGLNISINIGGPLTLTLTGGMAFDGHGNVGGYIEYGGGVSTSPDASGGATLHVSNGNTIYDLNGLFTNVTVGGGYGPHISGDAFYGYGSEGQRVEGTGWTAGAGVGASSAVTITNTYIGGTPSPSKDAAFSGEHGGGGAVGNIFVR